MRLYVLDDQAENPLVCRPNVIDHDYEAEKLVRDYAEGRKGSNGTPLIMFILWDDFGIRCVWERSADDDTAFKLPEITKVATRYTGRWQHSTTPSDFLPISDPYELVVCTYDAQH